MFLFKYGEAAVKEGNHDTSGGDVKCYHISKENLILQGPCPLIQ